MKWRNPFRARYRVDYHEQAVLLQEAINGVYAAHGLTGDHVPVVAGNRIWGDYGALHFSEKILMGHLGHEECDAELFHLDYVLTLCLGERLLALQ